jgi:signal peptidase II
VLDAVSKLWAVSVLAPAGEMPLLDGIIALRFARNFGAAFSSFSGATLLLSLFSLCVCTAIGWYLMKNVHMHPLEGISLTMIFAGGAGNLIDRVLRGYVVDFFEFQFVKFAVFNVADILITTGAVLLFIALMRGGNEG